MVLPNSDENKHLPPAESSTTDEIDSESDFLDSVRAIEPERVEALKSLLDDSKRGSVTTTKSDDPFFRPTSEKRNRSLIARVLENRTPQERAQILRTAYEADLNGDDPLFAVLLATGQLEFLLEKQPDRIETLFGKWQQQFNKDFKYADALFEQHSSKLRHYINETEDKLKLQSQAALDVQSKNISASVNHLVKGAAYEKVAADLVALGIAGGVLLAVIAIGTALGWSLAQSSKPTLDPNGKRQLTLEEAIALDWGMSQSGKFARHNPELIVWARSNQGQYARKLMEWNQSLLNGDRTFVCEKDARQLSVTLRLEGRQAKSGFCTLWVRPPEERKFIY